MDIIFDAEKDDLQVMMKVIDDFVKNNNVTISNNAPTILIYEGLDFDCKLVELINTKGIAEYINSVVNNSKLYKRCLVLFGLHEGVVYLMFTNNTDVELPKVVAMATAGWC